MCKFWISNKYVYVCCLNLIVYPFFNYLRAQSNDSVVKIYYDASGKILNEQNSNQAKYYRVINYKNENFTGEVKDFYPNGKLMMTGHYANNSIKKGNENGEFIWYYENGKIFQSCKYFNGLLNGPYTEFYQTGLKKTMISYVNGRRYGCEYAWNEQGIITHRAFMNENGTLEKSAECDTAFITKTNQDDIKPVPTIEVPPPNTQGSKVSPKPYHKNYTSEDFEVLNGLIDLDRVDKADKEYFLYEFRNKSIFGKSKIRFAQSKEYNDIIIGYEQRGKKEETQTEYMYYNGILFRRIGNYLDIIRQLPNGIGIKMFMVSPPDSVDEKFYERYSNN